MRVLTNKIMQNKEMAHVFQCPTPARASSEQYLHKLFQCREDEDRRGTGMMIGWTNKRRDGKEILEREKR
jgi:hypothetical protein